MSLCPLGWLYFASPPSIVGKAGNRSVREGVYICSFLFTVKGGDLFVRNYESICHYPLTFDPAGAGGGPPHPTGGDVAALILQHLLAWDHLLTALRKADVFVFLAVALQIMCRLCSQNG